MSLAELKPMFWLPGFSSFALPVPLIPPILLASDKKVLPNPKGPFVFWLSPAPFDINLVLLSEALFEIFSYFALSG
jgi:hypothetical protein